MIDIQVSSIKYQVSAHSDWLEVTGVAREGQEFSSLPHSSDTAWDLRGGRGSG